MKMTNLWLRALTSALCLCMVLSLAACGGPSTSSDADSDISGEIGETTKKPTKTKKTTEATSTTTTADSGDKTTAAGTTAVTQAQTTQKQTVGTTKTTKPVNYKFKATDYIRNTDVMKTRYFGGDKAYPHVTQKGALVDSSIGMYGNSDDLKIYSLEEHGFFVGSLVEKHHLSEWGNYFLHVEPGYDGGFTNGPVLDEVGYRKETPKDKKDALRIIKNWVFKQFKDYIPDPNNITQLDTCTGFYLWNQYALEWGATSLGAEVGETIMHTQASISFIRGGSRQYDVPGWVDMSNWYSMSDYDGENGHSPSLSERTAMATIMSAGASIMAEAGFYTMLEDTIDDEKGIYNLNAMGKAYKRVADFIKANPDLGYSYAPFGIVLDYYHGMDRNWSEGTQKKTFGYFPYNNGDKMTEKLFELFFPGGWGVTRDETHYLVNGPYGDTADALLQTASQTVLDSYPCIILSGDITLSNDEANRYMNYAKNGGTLILNTAYLKFFSAYKSQYGSGNGTKEFADGKGKVIVYGPDYDVTALNSIIEAQLTRLMPVTVSEQVEYLVNIKNGSVIVTLINNEGWTKAPGVAPSIDSSKKKEVTVTYTGDLAVKSIKEIYGKTKITVNGKAATATVKPGEIKVLEFKFD